MNLFAEFERTDFETWKKEAEKLLKDKHLDTLSHMSDEGIKINPLYTQQDLPDLFINQYPGFKYYLRSNKVTGYKTCPWEVVQRIEAPEAEKANNLIKNEMQNGVNAFHLALFDFSEENLRGVIVNNVKDLEVLFDDIDISNVHLHFKTALPYEFLVLLFAYLENKQFSGRNFYGSIQYDFLDNGLSKGRLLEAKQFYHLFSECYQLCNEYLPNFKSIVVDGTTFHECGANAIQELAFSISEALGIFKSLIQLGFDVQSLSQKILFKISLSGNIFFNIAKIRALRLLWSFIIEQFKIENYTSNVPIYAVTSERNKSKLDIYVNMLRNTTETFSAILGTADYIEVTPYDFILSEPSEFSMRNARNTQLVLMEEHNLREVIDPAGGSWFIEAITWEIAHKSFEMIKNIESKGGFYENLSNGYIQDEIKKAKTERLRKLSRRDIVFVGVNQFPNPQDKIERISPKSHSYNQYLKEKKTVKDKDFERLNFNDLIQLATSGHSILSLSPISYREDNFIKVEPLLKFREAEEFENLRYKAFVYQTKYGKPPKALAITFDNSSNYREPIDFVSEIFHIGGFEVELSGDIVNVEDAFAKFAELLPQVVVYCSSVNKYPEFLPQLTNLILKFKPMTVILTAGQVQEELFSKLKENGVVECIHSKSDILSILDKIFQLIS